MLRFSLTMLVLSVLTGPALRAQMSYEHPIPFAPRHYLCYQTTGVIDIDGKLEDPDWVKAAWTEDFVDIEGRLKPRPPLRTRAKMLWDEKYLYIGAELEEPHVWARLQQRDTVIFYDDDFEVFIDPDGDGTHYYEFELNALNTVWDLLMLRPYRDTLSGLPHYLFNWNLDDWQTAVDIQGTLNDPGDRDRGWTVEMAIPWSALRELARPKRAPGDGEYWRINFSRVDWHMDIRGDRYLKRRDAATGRILPEENWVWSPSGRISMHQPETWGYLHFTTEKVGSGQASIPELPEEKIKWALWQLFYQQHAYYAQFRRFSRDRSQFDLPQVDIPDYQFQPVLFTTASGFEILAPSLERGIYWRINEQGRIRKK